MIFYWQEPPWKDWKQLRQRLPHAILIQSGEGLGEFEFAQACAQSLLCEDPRQDRRPCGACRACDWFSLGNHPDFRLIVPESMAPESREEGAEPAKKKSEQIRIEQVRELAEFLAVGTHRGGLRVILVYPAEAMNANTQNALLKNLEEPPPATAFLLVTTQPERLLATVRSRCLKFSLPLPPSETVARVPLWDLVGWLQRWSYDLLLARVAGRVRYGLHHEKVISDTASHCDAADIAAYLRRLAQARALARHPLNAKLFVEDLLLQYRRLVARP